jgi:hypothetical protein
VGVVRQVVDEVGNLQIHLVAGGDQLGETDAPRSRPRQQRAEDAAALRDHGDVADGKLIEFQCAAGRKRDRVVEIDQADGVRSQQAHRAGCRLERLLSLRACRPGFGVSAGEHDGGGSAAGSQLPNRLFGALGPEQHDADVGRFGQ